MSKIARISFKVLDLLIIFVMTFGAPMTVLADPSPTGATITSDLADYPPGATVTLTGAGWAANESVHLFINDDAFQSWSHSADVTAASDGYFLYQFQLPSWFVANYSVTASGATSGTATTAFTDLSIGTYDQCANDDNSTPPGTGYPPSDSDPGCQWIGGNLQSNTAYYAEGDATVQRVWLTGFAPGTTHTVTLQYGTTKGGKHAYDFLTTWDWSEDWITEADRCQDITGCVGLGESKLDIPEDPSVPNSFEPSAVGDRQFVMRGGALNSATTPAIESGTYAGDSETIITVNFTVASSGAMCPTSGPDSGTCGVVLWFGAHVSAQANWGAGLGAGSISGSPYHVSLYQVDGASVGKRDNQMQSQVVTQIPNGTIIIVKDAIPNDAQDFSFNLTNNSTISQNFLLDDDSNATLPNSQTFSVPPGTWTATELNIPSGWTLTNLVCVDPTNNTTVNGAIATIDLASSETVTCTYTDTKEPDKLDLTVTKTATPSLTRTYTWGINKNVDKTTVNIAEGGTTTFNYTVDVTHDAGTNSGWQVTGQITVNNPNGFSVSGVNVTDSIDPNATCVVSGGSSTIAANSSASFNYTCTYSAAPAASSQTNTATATWTPFGSPNSSASGTASVDWSTATTALVDESVTVTDTLGGNLGTVSYTDTSPKSFQYSKTFSGVAGTCTNYDNTATFTTNDSATTGSSSKTVTVCVGKDLTVTKTATASKTRTYKWLIDKSVDDTRIEIAEGGTATFNYSVLVTPNGFTDSGFTLGGSITVANPNDWEDITLTGLSDTLDAGGTCSITEAGPYVVPHSGSLTVHYTCTTNGTSTKNTATATWNKATAFTPNGSASGDANVSFSATEVNKTITVMDDKTDPAHPVTLGTWNFDDGPHTFTYSLSKSGVGGTCTNYTNTAVIDETDQSDSQTVTVCVGKDLTVSKTAAGTFNRSYQWSISKNVDKTSINIADGGTATFNYTVDVAQTGITDSGWTLSGVITISNPNDWEVITLTNLSDTVNNGGTCTVDAGPYVVPASGSLDVNYTCSYASAPSSYSGTNTATATWDKAANFTPTGSASGAKDFTLSQLGSTNKTIHVTDSLGGALGTVTANDSAPFASKSFTYSKDFEGVGGTCTTYDNTATITEAAQSASQTVEVCVGLDLTVSKTAAGTFDREYFWSIDKNADATEVSIAAGGSYTFHYTVDVKQTGFTDSGFEVNGIITVANPNDWEAVTLSSLSDAVDNGGTCTVAAGPYLVPASGSINVNYTCSFASDPSSYSGTNTATANWDAATYFTPSGSANGSAPFTLSQDGATNKTIHVTDSFGGDLGSVTATDSDPFASASFEYDRKESGVAGTCTTYDNTATITETGQTADESVQLCVGLDLTVEKTATASKHRTYLWKIDKSVDDTRIEIADGGTATFNYTVTVSPDGYTDSGFTLGGTITISNPNDWEDIAVDVADTLDQGGTCSITEAAPYVVPASDSLTLHYTCTTDGTTIENTAAATWDKDAYFTPTGTASGSAPVTFALDQETNKDITVVDDKTDPLNPVTLGSSNFFTGPFEFTYSLDKSGVAGTCTDYTNTATIDETDQSDSQTVTVCVGVDLTVTKTAAGTFDRTYLWSIDKNADATDVSIAAGGSYTFSYTVDVAQTGISDSGWEVHGTITIANPNDWQDVSLDSLSDAVDNGGTCTVAAGPYLVPAGDSLNVNYTCSFASGPSSYSGSNTATATWNKTTYFTPTGSDSGSANFTLAQDGSTNKTIHVTDSYAGPLGTVTATDAAPFASDSFTYDRTESGVAGTCTEYDNTATITETGQTADETVTLCVGADLTVTKTANPTFKRTYLWEISKSVDKTLVEQVGGSAVFNYTVIVNQTGFTDSTWAVTGVITVSNPNDWQAVTVDLTDGVDNGGTCSVTNGTGVVVPASGTASRNYSCTFSSGTSGTNTATATWNKDTYFTPSGSASGTAGFSFTTPTTTVNKTVTVTDTFNGTTTTLGTVTATDGAPFASKTFTYSRSVPVPASGCKSYDNTAKIVETGQTASRTITVCGPLNLGGKTIGFWQNKNGQDIIKKAGAISGVCKLTPWLRQFAPFQDLSTTASCTAVATYVTNIIKAANASGASMNAMLKAQMLATALDVYFSDPALGGNKIGAPVPIGGVTIDLTYIKYAGGYQNVSSAFGGATSLTVSQMLAYAASQSNVGGSLWYANIKSTQELAKNAFDAINNNWVFAP